MNKNELIAKVAEEANLSKSNASEAVDATLGCILNALKSGDTVLVQVTKDPVGHKGARLTSQISLPGRYLVYVPGGSMTGISRKLPDVERNRLKRILKDRLPEHAGVIVRTAAEGASEEEGVLQHDSQLLPQAVQGDIPDVMPIDTDAAFGRRHKTCQNAHGGGFACAVGSKKTDNFTGFGLE